MIKRSHVKSVLAFFCVGTNTYSNRQMSLVTLKDYIASQLDCGVCLGRLKDAKSLSCMHTFCSECINGLKHHTERTWNSLKKSYSYTYHVACPMCRDKTTVPCSSRSASSLKSNLFVNKALEALSHYEKASAGKCFCEVHPLSECSRFCEKCELVVCPECALSDHGGHPRRIKALSDVCRRWTDDTVRLLGEATEWIEHHSSYLTDLKTMRKTGNDRADAVMTKILTAYDLHQRAMHSKLCGAREGNLEIVETKRRSFNNIMDEHMAREADAISVVTKLVGSAEELLDASPQELVAGFKEYSERMKQELGRKVPSRLEERRLLNTIKNLRFEKLPIPTSLVLQIGEVQDQRSKLARGARNNAMAKAISVRIQRPQRCSLTRIFEISGDLKTMAADSEGGLITGYRNGHMEVFNSNGGRIKVQANISARDIGVLSNGRFVTLTRKNRLHVYEADGSPLLPTVTFDIEGEDFVDAIAVDNRDNIHLLFPEQALIVVFLPSGGPASSRLHLDCPIPSGVSEMTVSVSSQILIVTDDAVLTLDAEGGLCQQTGLARTERASCDRQGNLWVLSFHSVRHVTAQVMLDKYNGEDGSHIASAMVPTRHCRKGFDSWGIALSESSFAALIADNEIAFFALSRSEQ